MINVKIYKYKVKATISDDIVKFTDFLTKAGFKLNTTTHTTKYKKKEDIYKLVEKDTKVMYLYNWKDYDYFDGKGWLGMAYDNGLIILGTDKVQDSADFTWKSMVHEFIHTQFHRLINMKMLIADPMDSMLVDGQWVKYYKNNDPYAPDGNYQEALRRLKPYMDILNNEKIMYKYFKEKEIVGLKPELVRMLDKARGIANTPFIITSGFRTPEHNKEVGGVENSSHIKGLAVDISVTTKTRQNILRGLLNCGIPVFIEDCPKHIHVDIDSSIHSLGGGIVAMNG